MKDSVEASIYDDFKLFMERACKKYGESGDKVLLLMENERLEARVKALELEKLESGNKSFDVEISHLRTETKAGKFKHLGVDVYAKIFSRASDLRRLRIYSQTPKMCVRDEVEMRGLVKNRDALKLETGIKHAVDHVWPIAKGGVNHPCNMEVITHLENTKKNDSHDGESGVSYADYELAITAYA